MGKSRRHSSQLLPHPSPFDQFDTVFALFPKSDFTGAVDPAVDESLIMERRVPPVWSGELIVCTCPELEGKIEFEYCVNCHLM